MSDLISRKAILKHIEKIRRGAQMIDDIRESSIIMWGMNLLEETVMNQPEIIHCGNCKHHSDEEPGMVYCPEIIGGWVKNDHFCAIWDGKR